MLRRLDATLVGTGDTFPVFRSDDGSAAMYRDPRGGTITFIVADFLESEPAVKVFEKERFRVGVLRGKDRCDDCDRQCFWLEAQFLDPREGEWKPLLMLHESKLDAMLWVLHEVEQFLLSPEERTKRATTE
jgi:hypothetical protein